MKAARTFLFTGLIVAAVSGCHVYDRSLLQAACETPGVGCLPAPPPTGTAEPDGSADIEGYWALTNIDLDQTSDSSDWSHAGLDLDGYRTTLEHPKQACVPAGNMAIPIDGANGIDNVYGQAFFPTFIRAFLPQLSDQLCCWGNRGRGTLLVRLRHWNGTPNDPQIELSLLYAVDATTDAASDVQWDTNLTERGLVQVSAPSVPAARPSWQVDTRLEPPRTATRWYLDRRSFIGGDPENPPIVIDENAYARDGFVVMSISPAAAVTLLIGDDISIADGMGRGGSLEMTLHGARAWARFSDDFSTILDGGIAGRIGKNPLLDASRAIGVCSLDLSTIAAVITGYGDVYENPLDDAVPGKTCTAISFGVTFRGVRGDFGGVAPASHSLCLPTACAADPAQGACPPLGSDHGKCGTSSPMTPIPTCPPLPDPL